MTDEVVEPEIDPDYPLGHEDNGEGWCASDYGIVVIPDGTAAILYAQMLEDLKAAGFEAPVEGVAI